MHVYNNTLLTTKYVLSSNFLFDFIVLHKSWQLYRLHVNSMPVGCAILFHCQNTPGGV